METLRAELRAELRAGILLHGATHLLCLLALVRILLALFALRLTVHLTHPPNAALYGAGP